MKDVFVRYKVLKEGVLIQEEGLNIKGFVYWNCMLMDVHRPIVERFGRYPLENVWGYRGEGVGRGPVDESQEEVEGRCGKRCVERLEGRF